MTTAALALVAIAAVALGTAAAARLPDPLTTVASGSQDAAPTTTLAAGEGPLDDLPLPSAAAAAEEGSPACRRSVSDTHTIERLSGTDRWATAACASEVAFPAGAQTVLLARGDDAGGFADALAGTVLAQSVGGPILLTDPASLPAPTRVELERIKPTRVLLLGGPGAISDAVAAEVAKATGAEVERLEGVDRAATAAAVSARAGATGTAFIVNGFRPADALVAGAPAARANAKLLLAYDGVLPQATVDALSGVTEIVVVGGFGVVNETVEARLRELVGAGHVRRLSGPTRSETAASVARGIPSPGTVAVVAGANANLVDAIGAGWMAARPGGGAVLYSEAAQPGRGTDRYLRLGALDDAPPVRLFGGERALTPELVDILEARLDEAKQGGPTPQIRATWVHLFDGTLKTRASIAKYLDSAVANNMNTVIVQVARRHDSYYNSDVLPRTPDPAMPADLDLLARLVPEAHARGLTVHAWYSLMPTYHSAYDGLDLGPTHIWNTHGIHTPEPWVSAFESDGHYAVYLDPGVPGVQDHIVSVLREVVERYDVDAVHLDYLRYDGVQWGYNPIALQRFQRETGRSDRPSGGFDAQFGAWRRQQTEDLVRRITVEVAEVDPTVAISMAAIAQGAGPTADLPWEATKAYADKFQDWKRWAELGLVDVVFPMDYFRDADARYAKWYDDWSTFTGSIDSRATTAIGLGAWLNGVGSSLRQADHALARNDGLAVYSYQQDNKDVPSGPLMSELGRTRFAQPANPPAMSWRAAPTQGHILVIAPDGTVVTRNSTEDGFREDLRTGASGTAPFAWIEPGLWRMSAPGFADAVVEVRAGEVNRVVLERR